MAADNVEQLVRRAWQKHREGDSASAVDAFASIVRSHPQDIDARYGLGITHKAAGRNQEAVESFRAALQLVESGQQAQEEMRHHGEDDRIRTPEDDRLTMLARMLTQRIAETEGSG